MASYIGVWREAERLVSRPCRRRRPSSLDDGGISPDWVLSAFSSAEETDLAPALEHAAGAVQELIRSGPSAAAAKYNGL